MEVHFSISSTKKEDQKKIQKKISDELEKKFDILKKQGLKGIPREFVADKLIFIFQGKKAVINVSVKTWVTLFENIVPMMKKIKIGGIEIGAPKIIYSGGDEWKADSKIKLAGGQRWKTLSHNGIYLGEPYQPHKKPLMIGSEKLVLKPVEEELFTLYATRLAQDTSNPDVRQYTQEVHFINRYCQDLETMISKATFSKIKPFIPKKESDIPKFNKMFNKIVDHLKKVKEKTKEEKDAIKKRNIEIKMTYGMSVVDGRKEPIGNFKVEPPGLFLGRGDNPKRGCIKARVKSSDVTINIGNDEKIPVPNDKGKWGKIVHDNTVTWLATWKDRCTGESKYVFLAPTSKIKGESDMAKYEKARVLATMIDNIVEDYTKKMKSKSIVDRQLGTIVYLIDHHAFRVGNEKGADEADTVGVSTLKVSHLSPEGENNMIFNFLGKDSVQFFSTLKLDATAYKNLVDFRKGKKPGDQVFDKVGSKEINDYLKTFMSALTAKVFRTFRASSKYYEQLKGTKSTLTLDQKIKKEKDANRAVAVLCNHTRKVTAKAELALTNKKAELKELKKTLKSLSGKKLDAAKIKVAKMEALIEEKSSNRDKACTTSKTGYIDPRIAVAWSYKFDVPLNKIYSATLIKKFNWAIQTVDKKWDYFKSPINLIVEKSEKKSSSKAVRTRETKSSKTTRTTRAAKPKVDIDLDSLEDDVLAFLNDFDDPVKTIDIAKHFGVTKTIINKTLYAMQDKTLHKFSNPDGTEPRWLPIEKSPVDTKKTKKSFVFKSVSTKDSKPKKVKDDEEEDSESEEDGGESSSDSEDEDSEEDEDEEDRDTLDKQILDYLESFDGPVKTIDILKHLKQSNPSITKKEVNAELYRMKDIITKTSNPDGTNPRWEIKKGKKVSSVKSKKSTSVKSVKSKKATSVKSKQVDLSGIDYRAEALKSMSSTEKISFEISGCRDISVSSLKAIAKKLKVPGYSKMTKKELCVLFKLV